MVTSPKERRSPRLWPFRRLALGLAPTPGPGLVLLLVGLALGPGGLGVLSGPVISALDPAVSVALAALGVFVGLDIRLRGPREGRLLAAASLEAATTMLVVGAGFFIVSSLIVGVAPSSWLVAAMLGVCAAPSSTSVDRSEAPRTQTSRIGDLDDVLPIVVAGVAAVWIHSPSPGSFASMGMQSIGIAAAVAAATWLLITQTSSESEQRVFVIGALLLLGGAAAHLSLSALAAGLLAGLCWNIAGGQAREHLARDMRYLQHPLTVPLLVVAGARLQAVPYLLTLAAIYVIIRTVAKLLGSRFAWRLAYGESAPTTGILSLSSPGVVAIAIALNLLQAGGESEAARAVFAVVVTGSLASELLSLLAPHGKATT